MSHQREQGRHLPSRPIRISLLVPESRAREDPEWYTEREALDHLFDVLDCVPDWDGVDAMSSESTGDHGHGHDRDQDVYDSPWDHPEVPWVDPGGTRYRVEREA